MKSKTEKYTSDQIVELIRQRFEIKNNSVYNQCVVLEQVPDATSRMQNHWIDVAAFQMWEMKGLTRSAFEVKVSRADFLAELNNPEKHQWCYECFHEFWFVAPKDVIQIEELPIGVGWMYPRGKSLAIARNAVRNRNPRLDDHLLAGFMRAAYKEIKAAGILQEKAVLNGSVKYRDATYYQKAVEVFLEKRCGGKYFHDLKDHAEILESLEVATLDKELIADRNQLLDLLNGFQNSMQGLFGVFAVIANRALLEKDDLGKYLVSRYGGVDKGSLTTLKERAKSKKDFYSSKELELLEIILNWRKEFPIEEKSKKRKSASKGAQ